MTFICAIILYSNNHSQRIPVSILKRFQLTAQEELTAVSDILITAALLL